MPQELDLKRFKLPADIAKPFFLIAAYGAWILVFRLMALSFLVYFLTRAGRTASFEEINESFATNEIVFIGLGSTIFLVMIRALSPLLDRAGELRFSFSQFRISYLPGFFQGLALASGVIAALVLVGSLRFVGFFVQIEDTSFAVFGIVLRVLALFAMGLCEEILFRSRKFSNLFYIFTLAVIYCVVKLAQFDLSWMHFATLFLLSAALSVKRVGEDSFLKGAGFWSAILIVFHPIFSLPIFGNDFSGILLLKYQPQKFIPPFISGGPGGPLSGVILQAILLIEIVRGLAIFKIHKKSLFKHTLTQ
jgi:hypothetical protein